MSEQVNELFEDGTRKTICTISTRSKTLWLKSRRAFALGHKHDEIYAAGLEALLKEGSNE